MQFDHNVQREQSVELHHAKRLHGIRRELVRVQLRNRRLLPDRNLPEHAVQFFQFLELLRSNFLHWRRRELVSGFWRRQLVHEFQLPYLQRFAAMELL